MDKADVIRFMKQNVKDEMSFGEMITDLVNIALANGAPFPTMVFQLETIAFELRYKQARGAEMQIAAMMANKVAKASSIMPAKSGDIPKIKKG